MSPTVEHVITFLTLCFEQGLGYSALNSARSALSSIITINNKPVGSSPIIVRFLKGAYNLRPCLPKNNVTWDPVIVLTYLKSLSPVKFLSLKDLTFKAATLLWLLTAQRGQTLSLIDIRNITLTKHRLKIRLGDKLKQTRPGFHLQEINIKAYAPDRRVCIVTVMLEYSKRTTNLRGKATRLFISYVKPHGEVSKDTLARWIKTVLNIAGIDMTIFTPHSVRSASTSAAFKAKVPLETILNTAGWSQASTFRKYYNKGIKTSQDFSKAILKS
jgi:hypothetical protein